MAETNAVLESEDQADGAPRPKAALIESRFLFVDVAAMRAKQLRRGALPRLSADDEAADEHRVLPFKAERVAMEEVRRGLVQYDVPGTMRTGDPH
ncbi:MAG TPA: DNA-directed RNA polymerase subunit omega [Vicinamibacterales bacterium]|nr:DNA-directed RNA polymerase subunit omega [Vicinamibacterales bacterium]